MSIWLLLALAVAINMAGFFIAYKTRSDKLTDFSYGATFLVIALLGLIYASSQDARKAAVFVMVGLWSVRLAAFLLIRIMKKKKDKRFDGVRENFKKFGTFWFFQGVTVWLIMLPIILMYRNISYPVDFLSYAGLCIWAFGLTVESLADWEKYRFGQQPANKNKWIDEGLWHYSRHPNYLGEILVWVGVYLFTFSALGGGQKLIALISPVYISFLLIFVTGIPKLEKYADDRWGGDTGYQSYKKRTGILIPFI